MTLPACVHLITKALKRAHHPMLCGLHEGSRRSADVSCIVSISCPATTERTILSVISLFMQVSESSSHRLRFVGAVPASSESSM